MISIILTVHNKEFLIEKVIKSIIDFTTSPFEFIVVYDGCIDNSEKIVNEILSINNGKMIAYNAIYTDDVFETKANNAGMKNSNGNYFILIQDDMIINEFEWEKKLIKPFKSFDNVITVSSRSSFNVSPRSKVQSLRFTETASKEKGLKKNIFAIRDATSRGPLAIDASKIKKMNYFDEIYAPYIWDDQDLCLRAYREYGWISGAYLTDYISEPLWGTTRNKNISLYFQTYKRNSDIAYKRHHDAICGEKHTEDRVLI